MRVAVTGAGGRLGRALVAALADAPFTGPAGPIAWGRADFDLDAPDGVDGAPRPRPAGGRRPCAAWTDVDGCARDPELAHRAATARRPACWPSACAARGIDLLVVSTNEVFDGRRTDGRGLRPRRRTAPVNPYGASKLDGRASSPRRPIAGTGRGARLGIVRTAWLYGPPGNDFPRKIVAAAERAAAAGEPLRVVADEWGSPTTPPTSPTRSSSCSAADAVGGHPPPRERRRRLAGRLGRELSVQRAGLDVAIEEVPASTWARASTPPRVGRPRADAAAVRRADPPVAGRHGRLPAPLLRQRLRRRSRADEPRPAPPPSTLPRRRAIGAVARHADERGSFRELWRASAFPMLTSAETGAPAGSEPRFVQANLSTSAAGVLRGLHYHRRQLDYWVVASRPGVRRPRRRPADARRAAATAPVVETRELAADDGSTSRPASPTASSPSSRSSCSTS